MKKAFGYIRVSSINQIEGDGLVRQEQAIRDWGQSHDVEIVKIFADEGVSGTTEDRQGLAQLLVSVELNGHGINTVIIEKLDRLARDLMVQEGIINDIRKTGCELISVCEGEDLLSDEPTRQLVRQMMGAIAQYEKSMIVQKLRVARERKKIKDGKCEGRKSYVEAAPHIVKEIKRLRRKTKGIDKRKSYNWIAEHLNRNGFKTLMGKDFTAGIVKNILATS